MGHLCSSSEKKNVSAFEMQRTLKALLTHRQAHSMHKGPHRKICLHEFAADQREVTCLHICFDLA